MSKVTITGAPHKAILRAAILGSVLAFGTGIAMVPAANAAEEINIKDGVAVHGHDVVAYFKDGKPTKGKAEFSATHDGATYHFASAANRDAFKADPGHYAPQYGGFCAYGTSVGRKFDGDPEAWKIVDGKLYLNLDKKVQAIWSKDPAAHIRGADHNWPLIQATADKVLEKTPPAGITIGPQ